LKKIHGSIQHTGRSPVNKPQESSVKPVVKVKVSQVQELKNQLQSAIQKEEFEKAAGLRDKIKELEKKGEI
jgi:protein arginine kinase activator